MVGIAEAILGNPVTKLQERNKTADQEITKIIKKVSEETAALEKLQTKNNAVITKINKIFE